MLSETSIKRLKKSANLENMYWGVVVIKSFIKADLNYHSLENFSLNSTCSFCLCNRVVFLNFSWPKYLKAVFKRAIEGN